MSASFFGKEGLMRKAAAYLAVSLDGYIADADGGVALIAAAADAGEVGRWHLTVLPVLLGSGIRLFPEGQKQSLRLVSARQSGGMAELIYEPEVR